MAEPIEELEPLFDYTRVQPFDVVCLDDEDGLDFSPSFPSKRRKSSDSAVENKKIQEMGKVIEIIEGEEEDDLDWLAPPPKVAVDAKKLCENSTIKELRLKKQELMSFTQSAEDLLRSVEESVKRDLKPSMESECESPVEKPSKPPVERPKIVISIQDKDGSKQFRIYMDDKFERLFKMYAEKSNHKVESLVFCFDGGKIDPTATPSSLEMEDDDMIEVHKVDSVMVKKDLLRAAEGLAEKKKGAFSSQLAPQDKGDRQKDDQSKKGNPQRRAPTIDASKTPAGTVGRELVGRPRAPSSTPEATPSKCPKFTLKHTEDVNVPPNGDNGKAKQGRTSHRPPVLVSDTDGGVLFENLQQGQYGATVQEFAPRPKWHPDWAITSKSSLYKGKGREAVKTCVEVLKAFDLPNDAGTYTPNAGAILLCEDGLAQLVRGMRTVAHSLSASYDHANKYNKMRRALMTVKQWKEASDKRLEEARLDVEYFKQQAEEKGKETLAFKKEVGDLKAKAVEANDREKKLLDENAKLKDAVTREKGEVFRFKNELLNLANHEEAVKLVNAENKKLQKKVDDLTKEGGEAVLLGYRECLKCLKENNVDITPYLWRGQDLTVTMNSDDEDESESAQDEDGAQGDGAQGNKDAQAESSKANETANP